MLYGERIYLRAVEDRDVPLRAGWFNDPEVRAELHVLYPFSEVATREWVRRVSTDERRKDFAICLIDGDRTVGFTGLVDINWRHAKAENYLVVGDKQTWGQGFGKEAARLVLEYAFRELRLHRVYAYTTNERFVRLTKSLGYQLEGVLRGDIYSGGEFHDRTMLGITAADFQALSAGTPQSPSERVVRRAS